MAASSLRHQTTFPTPHTRNRGAIRYDTVRGAVVYSDGTDWRLAGTRKVQRQTISVRAPVSADQVSQTIFIAQGPVTVVGAYEVHAAASGVADDVLKVWKTESTDAPGSATSTLLTSFDLNGTANTVQTGTLTTTEVGGSVSVLKLAAGDRLSISFVGTLTSLTGVLLTVVLESEAVDTVNAPAYAMALNPLNGDNVDQTVFVAPVPCRLIGVREVHATAGTNGSAVTVTVKKNGVGGTALTDALSLKATINTVQTAVLSTVAGALDLNTGDYITLDFAGTITAVAGVAVSLVFETMYPGMSFIVANHGATADMADSALFIAPGLTQLAYTMEIHGTATNGAAKAQLVKDTGTDAPGAGTDILTNNTNAGFDVNATALTVQDGGLNATRSVNCLALGDRLSVDYSAATTGGAKVCIVAAVNIL